MTRTRTGVWFVGARGTTDLADSGVVDRTTLEAVADDVCEDAEVKPAGSIRTDGCGVDRAETKAKTETEAER